MSGPKRNPDKLNTIGVVVVGICTAVLVYVSIVALEAFYLNDSSEVQTMADYGGQDTTAKGHKADELRNITEAASNQGATPTTYRIPIEQAIQLVVRDANRDPAHLVPALPRADKATIQPIFGRPLLSAPLAPVAPAGAGSGSAAAGSGSAAAGSGSAAAGSGSGSAAGVPLTPTGTPGQPPTVPGAGGTKRKKGHAT